MADVFISHEKADADIALELALALEGAGYSTWCYEVDQVAGSSYLGQIADAIEEATAIALIASPHSVGSRQVTNEVYQALELGKHFVPLLRDLEHAELQKLQREWRGALGGAVSLRVPAGGLGNIVADIIQGLRKLGIRPKAKPNADRIAKITRKLGGANGTQAAGSPAQQPRVVGGPERGPTRLPWWARLTLAVPVLLAILWLGYAARSRSPVPDPPPPQPFASPITQPQRIAIMNFENRRPHPDHDWMCEGLRDDFVTALNDIAQLEVFADPEVRLFGEGEPDAIKAAQRAGMAKIVRGAFAVERDMIHIWASVTDVNSRRTITSIKRDGPLQELGGLRNQVVVELLKKLQFRLPEVERELFQKPQRTNLMARKLLFDAERAASADAGSFPTPTGAIPDLSYRKRLRPALPPISVANAAEEDDSKAHLEADLSQTLEHYRAAFERKDIDAVGQYYARFTDTQKAALMEYFRNADRLQVRFSDARISIVGETAAVSYTRTDDFVDHRSGEEQHLVVRQTKLFGKGRAGWQIVPDR